jgi:hypothetical protein
MYNRYIPQPDGSYRKDRVHVAQPHPPRPEACPPPPPPPKEDICERPCQPEAPACPPPRVDSGCKPHTPAHRHEGSLGFLGQLLPKDFDTGDLIVVLLLLLLAGDCEEDRSTALLTLALYLFM